MELLNADGSYSEVSGNGVRCLAAWIAFAAEPDCPPRSRLPRTPASSASTLLERSGSRYTFRASMGERDEHQSSVTRRRWRARRRGHAAGGQPAVRRPGRGQPRRGCTRLPAALAVHSHFPEGTNVELAEVQAPDLRAHSDLGARGRSDRGFRDRGMCRGRSCASIRRRLARRTRVVSGRHAAGRVAGRRAVPDRVGRGRRRSHLDRSLAAGSR